MARAGATSFVGCPTAVDCSPNTMNRRVALVLMCVFSSLFIVAIFSNNVLVSSYSAKYGKLRLENDLANYSLATLKSDILELEKVTIRQSLADYDFKNASLDSLLVEQGGLPLHSIILTTWRSGSTFLGELLNSVPGNFYHYEPLLDFNIVQIRGPPRAKPALSRLKNLMKCDYSGMESYMKFGMAHVHLFSHNTRLWDRCNIYSSICWDIKFLASYCRLFPFQSMKLVRLRLSAAEPLLSDTTLNVKILLLVRDPRGTMQSRKHRDWCPGRPDCDDPVYVCSDMVSDYKEAAYFLRKYPGRFMVMRYEDFCAEMEKSARQVFDFFGLSMHPKVLEFLDSHTKLNIGGVSSTYRDSKNAPYHWRYELNQTEVQSIEKKCEEAMNIWGYVLSHGRASEKDFTPIKAYYLKDNN